MEFISTLASNFMGLFNAGGEQFVNWVTGIIPTVVCLMVAVNSIIKIITEHEFRAGDFYILRKNTPYIQKCQAGCRLLFAKVPGINDKISIPMSARMRQWCEQWDAVWKDE